MKIIKILCLISMLSPMQTSIASKIKLPNNPKPATVEIIRAFIFYYLGTSAIRKPK
jgi:hypothetical protein